MTTLGITARDSVVQTAVHKRADRAANRTGRSAGYADTQALRAALVGAAIVLIAGMVLSATLNIWVDEAFTLHTTGAGPVYALAQAIAFEGQPPLYFVLESLWRGFNESSIAFARFPSTVFAASAVAVIVLAARRIAPALPPLAVAVTTALNPMTVWAASEMRVYALVLLISAVLTWTFFEGFLVPGCNRNARVVYAVFAVAGLYTQYYLAFVLVAHVLALFILRRRSIHPAIGMLTLVGCAFLPFVSTALRHVSTSGDFVTHASPFEAWHALIGAALVFVLPHDPAWTGSMKYAGSALAVVLAAAVAIGRPRIAGVPARGVVAAGALSLIVFGIAFAISGIPADPLRHIVAAAPALLLTAYLALGSLSRHKTAVLSLATVAFAVCTLARFWAQYHVPTKLGDWQRVAALLATADASTPIAVFPAELRYPLAWYLARTTLPLPNAMPFTTGYVKATTLTDEAQVARVLEPAAVRARRLWLVSSDVCVGRGPREYDYHCDLLRAYLARHYRLVCRFDARGTSAGLYERLAGTGAPRVTHVTYHQNGTTE